ncbi:hypothetical protein COB21_00940 [Candidatus Aerophobetes bacterium]|uniref:Uncharacterized protein n=1 Tax=Aerophobetes bacterium TaxID=2030807 RepID=A0A2A4X8H8_UNCAE|nr:MAG: hypothetical protein COB21_00940 [Candidatus Aerophobetes bacterium]
MAATARYPLLQTVSAHVRWAGQARATSLRFAVRRDTGVDNKMAYIYNKAIAGLAHEVLDRDSRCSLSSVMGDCANRRGGLGECACEPLDRVRHPDRRASYESLMLAKSLRIIEKQRETAGSFSLNLVLFASGQLHAEETFLFKLFESLKQKQYSGSVNLFLIDFCYKSAIGKGAFSHDKALNQFVSEMRLTLPSSINLNGAVFASAQDYKMQAEQDAGLRYDVMHGQDIENANESMDSIRSCSRLPQEVMHVLVKQNNLASICVIQKGGELEIHRQLSPQTKVVEKLVIKNNVLESSTGFWKYIVIALSIAACICLIIYSIVNRNRIRRLMHF